MLELNYTYNALKDKIFKEPLVVRDGYLDLPDKPGFGVEPIDDVEKNFPYNKGDWGDLNPYWGIRNPNLPR